MTALSPSCPVTRLPFIPQFGYPTDIFDAFVRTSDGAISRARARALERHPEIPGETRALASNARESIRWMSVVCDERARHTFARTSSADRRRDNRATARSAPSIGLVRDPTIPPLLAAPTVRSKRQHFSRAAESRSRHPDSCSPGLVHGHVVQHSGPAGKGKEKHQRP